MKFMITFNWWTYLFICLQILWDFEAAFGLEVSSALLQKFTPEIRLPLLKHMTQSHKHELVRLAANVDTSDDGKLSCS